jgi:hypothetical protein
LRQHLVELDVLGKQNPEAWFGIDRLDSSLAANCARAASFATGLKGNLIRRNDFSNHCFGNTV